MGPFRGGRVGSMWRSSRQPTHFFFFLFWFVGGGVLENHRRRVVGKAISTGKKIAFDRALAVALRPTRKSDLRGYGRGQQTRQPIFPVTVFYKSTDGGHTWTNIGELHDSRQCRSMS